MGQKELVKVKIQEFLKEKSQLTANLNSTDKAFSDLFERFEKQRGDQRPGMNEESLKCVEDYIVRFEKEGPRY